MINYAYLVLAGCAVFVFINLVFYEKRWLRSTSRHSELRSKDELIKCPHTAHGRLERNIDLLEYTPMTHSDIWREMLHEKGKAEKAGFPEYKVSISFDDYALSVELLQVVHDTFTRNNLTYFMYAGTLLGSLRHHGPIPWDDDCDVMADWNERPRIAKAFKALEPDYFLHTTERKKFWKLFSNQSRLTGNTNVKWKWPFLDIWFFKRSDNTLCDISFNCGDIEYNAKDVFPLLSRPFAHLNLYAPWDSHTFVSKSRIDLDSCVSPTYDHRHERGLGRAKAVIPCKDLKKYYPFVERHDRGSYTEERLLFGGKIVSVRHISTNISALT